jgi:hypothetical protein
VVEGAVPLPGNDRESDSILAAWRALDDSARVKEAAALRQAHIGK